MKTIGDGIEEYVTAIKDDKAGELLYDNAKKIMALSCSDEIKERCFTEQINFIRIAICELSRK